MKGRTIKQIKRRSFWAGVGCCILFAFLVSVAYFIGNYASLHVGYLTEETEIVCNQTDLKQASKCALEELKGFYYYNISNIGKKLDFETLKQEGGVCSHYADWYIKKGEELGFYTKRVIIKTNKKTSHAFAIWSDEEGYVILDQIKKEFFGLE